MIPAVSATTAAGSAGLTYQWIAAGQGGSLYTSTSTTAASWTSQTSSFGTTNIYGIASNGISQFVAVGETGKLATSPDGIVWTQRTSSFGTDNILEIAYGNGYWVAVGDNAKVAYSTDGVTWTQKTTGITGSVYSVHWGNSLWVIGNSTGSFYTATDPTGTWTSRTSTLSNLSANGIHYFKGQSIWVAGMEGAATTGVLASSTDGTTWTARNSTWINALPVLMGIASNATTVVISGNTNVLTPTYDFQTSTNGTTFTDRTPANTTKNNTFGASDDADRFCFIGGANVQTSPNGTTWTLQSDIAVGFQATAICHSSGVPAIR